MCRFKELKWSGKRPEPVGLGREWKKKEGQMEHFHIWPIWGIMCMHGKGVLLGRKRQGRRCVMRVKRPCYKQMKKQYTKSMILMILETRDHPC